MTNDERMIVIASPELWSGRSNLSLCLWKNS